MPPMPMTTRGFDRPRSFLPLLLGAAVALSGCGDGPSAGWGGTVDTLASGQVVVANPADPIWAEGREWRLVEELRIGSMDAVGPELFGQLRSIDVDDAGRIYVLEAHAQEVRVFDRDGRHVRSIGRKGGGPGEFAEPALAEIGPHGDLWVVDPDNNRVSVFDSSGAYRDAHPVPGGFVILPWPGGFGRDGSYYYPVPDASDGDFRTKLVRYDAAMQPVDTLTPPRDPVQRDYFEIRDEGRFMRAAIPFSGSFQSRLSPRGTFWGFFTGDYRLFELSPDGDTLRTITRAFDPLPVTAADREEARKRLEWFTRQGGEVDWARLPDHKPAASAFAFDDDGRVWVWPVTEGAPGEALDVFDAGGRYLGRVRSPVPLSPFPRPVIGSDAIIGVTESELEVPYVVRLRIERPEAGTG